MCVECEEGDDPDILRESKYLWINDGVAIYQGKKKNKIFTLKENTNENCNVLYDKYKENRSHHVYDCIFLHKYCYKLLKSNKEKIKKWRNILNFMDNFDNRIIEDIAKNYDCQIGLSQYYEKGVWDNNEDQGDYIWLLEDPLINKKNEIRINNIFNKMLDISNIYLNFKDFIIIFLNLINNKNISMLVIDNILQYYMCNKIYKLLISDIIKYN